MGIACRNPVHPPSGQRFIAVVGRPFDATHSAERTPTKTVSWRKQRGQNTHGMGKRYSRKRSGRSRRVCVKNTKKKKKNAPGVHVCTDFLSRVATTKYLVPGRSFRVCTAIEHSTLQRLVGGSVDVSSCTTGHRMPPSRHPHPTSECLRSWEPCKLYMVLIAPLLYDTTTASSRSLRNPQYCCGVYFAQPYHKILDSRTHTKNRKQSHGACE